MYKRQGDIVKVEKLSVGVSEIVIFDQVLAMNSRRLVVGAPAVAGVTVNGIVMKEDKTKEVIIYKYKRKSGYHKRNGRRQLYIQAKIDKINA